MLKYPIFLMFVAVTSTVILVYFFKEIDTRQAMLSSGLTGLAIHYWFAYFEKRVPENKEIYVITAIYSVFVFIAFFGIYQLLKEHLKVDLGVMSILYVSYPMFMLIFFNKKWISKTINKNV